MRVNEVAVIGAGVMGAGVAQQLADTRHRVTLVDASREALDRALAEIQQGLRLNRMMSKRAPGERDAIPAVMERITATTDLEQVRGADYVIENITEDWGKKQPVYVQLDALCRPETIFAANTSAIPITRIGAATKRPSLVVGIHFMNPVPMKKTVELIQGFHTSPTTLEVTQQLLRQMEKEMVLVQDSPGFVSNRVLMLTINEAIFLVHEDVAAAKDVDQIFKSCFEHKMGPLETADLIGLDTILKSLEVLHDSFGDPKFRPCPLLKKMVDAGLHGRKSGQGFFKYPTATR